MAFIDSTYFTGEILIPSALGSTDSQHTQAMAQYEKEILIKLLGYELYALLQADLSAGVPQSKIYLDLVDGADFTCEFNGQEIPLHWNGLKNSDKVSLISYYTYHRFVERHIAEYHSTGITTNAEGKDWIKANPLPKICNVWERCRELYGKLPVRLKDITVPILGSDFSQPYDAEPSAFNFLLANKDDYPTWRFTPLWNINIFGI